VGRVTPLEGDLTIFESNQPVIGNGDAMRLTAEILQHMLRPAKGTLSVDDPVPLVGATQERAKELELTKCFQLPMKAQLACSKASRSASVNLPRNTRPSTRTGRKKWYFG
jgi:hypothetical protein